MTSVTGKERPRRGKAVSPLLHRPAALADDHEGCPEHRVGEVVFSLGLHHRQHGTAQANEKASFKLNFVGGGRTYPPNVRFRG